jgi:cytochrome subunit of sulfide dehydrogenase
MRRFLWMSSAAVALLFAAPVSAQAVATDSIRYVVANCANCHGTTGRSSGGMPSLAGLQAPYLAEQMRQFRDGKRPATIMHQIAKGYSEQQTEQLAEYFSRQSAK